MSSNSAHRVAGILHALAENRGHLTEAEAAELVFHSASHFRHEFRRVAGMSFRAARLRAKMAHGLLLLQTTDLPIPTISAELGYSDRTKFEKAFKRIHGCTPSVYRHQKDGR
jgi:AraC family transcriptional regulator of arabinose operon